MQHIHQDFRCMQHSRFNMSMRNLCNVRCNGRIDSESFASRPVGDTFGRPQGVARQSAPKLGRISRTLFMMRLRHIELFPEHVRTVSIKLPVRGVNREYSSSVCCIDIPQFSQSRAACVGNINNSGHISRKLCSLRCSLWMGKLLSIAQTAIIIIFHPGTSIISYFPNTTFSLSLSLWCSNHFSTLAEAPEHNRYPKYSIHPFQTIDIPTHISRFSKGCITIDCECGDDFEAGTSLATTYFAAALKVALLCGDEDDERCRRRRQRLRGRIHSPSDSLLPSYIVRYLISSIQPMAPQIRQNIRSSMTCTHTITRKALMCLPVE